MAGCTPTEPPTVAQQSRPEMTAPVVVAPAPQIVRPALESPSQTEHRVKLLIQQVDQAYARGESEYRKGRLAEAKASFDHAVDLMLLSGIDIKSTPQLEEEFNRILDQVNGLEMEALKRGKGFVSQEETPADAAAEVTFKVDPAFLARAQADLATTKSDLPLTVNEYVAAYINFFANTKKGHYTLLHSLQRAGRYKAMIQRVMAEEGVPQDLIYLAVAESGFNPRALNPKSHAGGMWQFMPTGNYGLAHNAYVDERFDPEKSTRAYARYMKFIYDQTGDWYLSMAGYDWGTGNVQRAVQKTGYADFWELYKRHNLPGETANYVPEILAAIIVANNPTKYGLDDLTPDPPLLTDTVTVNYSIDLRLVGDLVGASVEELEALNPSLLRRVTPPETSFDLHLPPGTATLFEQRVAQVPEAHRNGWRYHRIAEGETLATVARNFHVSVSDLADANKLEEDAELKGKEALVIPQAPVSVASSRAVRTYTVRKGDTLVTIADRFGVSLTQLRTWNKLPAGTKVDTGKKLTVTEPAGTVHSKSARKRGAASAAPEPEAPVVKGKKGHSASAAKEAAPAHATKGKGASTAKEKEAPAGKGAHAHASAEPKSSHAKGSSEKAEPKHAHPAKPATKDGKASSHSATPKKKGSK